MSTETSVLSIVSLNDLGAVAARVWASARIHPDTASCECPATEAILALLDLGYWVTSPKGWTVKGDPFAAFTTAQLLDELRTRFEAGR